MITVETPASFEWNDRNSLWVKHYLLPKLSQIAPLINEAGLDIDNMDETQFKSFCTLLEETAQGREIRNKMFKAWRSKKSRDSNNGKKLYTFNLSIKAGEQLKKIAKQTPLNKTLESLIFADKAMPEQVQKLQQEVQRYQAENKQLHDKLNTLSHSTGLNNDEQEIQQLIETDLQVTELAKLEKSKLIKQILLLKRQ